ncbi:MAG: hypothetical protein LBF83_04735 [Spirochaetaceae bacterium]|jgi:hypothetical protein|nr:hypothetical protein [Spirochaetaceae bacterium]
MRTLATITGLTVDGTLTLKNAAAAKAPTATETGSITISDVASLSASTTFAFPGIISFADTFVTTAATSFAGKVVFNGNLTLTAAPVTFEGAAFFKNGVVVTLANTSSAITLAGVTGALAVGAPSSATLTFATAGITQGGATTGIEITGKVAAIPAKSYTVAVNNTLKVDTNNEIALDAGTLADYDDAPEGKPGDEADWVAKLVLTGADDVHGALLTGAGSVVAGGAAIIGGTNGWKAVGSAGTVAIAKDAITASAATAVLTAVTGATQPSIHGGGG